MNTHEHLTRARGLLAAGRFQRRLIKTLETMTPISAQGDVVEGKTYTPYFDTTCDQMTFVSAQLNGSTYEQLFFSRFDYHYGAKDGLVWVDRDEG